MRLAALSLVALLTGCSHAIYIQPRDGGDSGNGTASGSGQSGKISIIVGSRIYSGRWVTAHTGSSFGLMQAYGTNSKGGSAVATGFSQNYSSGSSGNALMRSEDGSTLRCEFVYGGSAGYGVCQNNEGKLYDMQIN